MCLGTINSKVGVSQDRPNYFHKIDDMWNHNIYIARQPSKLR